MRVLTWPSVVVFVVVVVVATMCMRVKSTRGRTMFVVTRVPSGAVAFMDPSMFHTHAVMARQTVVPCSCLSGYCSCCSTISVPQVNFNQQACLNTIFDTTNLATGISFKVGDRVIFEQKLSASNPPPICYPIPQMPIITVCLRLYNIKLVDRGIYSCINVEVKVFGNNILVFNFDCVQITTSGVTVSKPISNMMQISDAGSAPVSSTQNSDDEYDIVVEAANCTKEYVGEHLREGERDKTAAVKLGET